MRMIREGLLRCALRITSSLTAWVRACRAVSDWNKLGLAISPFSRTTASRSSLPLHRTRLRWPAVSPPALTQRQKTWRIPAAWRAIVKDGQIAEWQVCADNKPVYELLFHRV